MAEHCDWHPRAALDGPAEITDVVRSAFDRAARTGVLCPDPDDVGLEPGPLFGPDPGALRLVTRTAGSTGRPRRVIRSQASWTRSFLVMARQFGLGPGDRYGVLGDLSHSLSFYALAEGLHLGAEVCLAERLDTAAQADLLERAAVTVLYTTPTQLRALDLAIAAPRAFPDVRQVIIGGGPFDAAAGRAVLRRFPSAKASVFYGTSETSFLTLGARSEDGSAPVFPQVDLRINAPDGVAGAVWVGGPYLASAYAEGDATDEDQPQQDLEHRICLGETGILLPDGRVRLMGRGAAMVTVADRNVFPAAVESWLLSQEGIGHAAVLPRTDSLRGNRLEAAICWNGGDLSRLKSRLRADLGTEATPARILVLRDWPLLPSGKTDSAQVRAALDLP